MSAIDVSSVALFEGLSEEEVGRCAGRFQQREFPAGSSLASEGDFAYKFFMVLDGEVEVHRDFEFVARLRPGDFFGEAGLVSGERRNARVTTKARTILAWIMGWDFTEMINEFPSVAERIETVIAERAADD